MNSYLKIIVTLASLFCASTGFSQESSERDPAATKPSTSTQFVERLYGGESKNNNASAAKKEIIDDAVEKTSELMIREIIGESKFQSQKSVVFNKVIKASARYIPFLKPGELTKEGDIYKMSVSLRVSLPDLQALLLENGLLYENEGAPQVLPFIQFVDRVHLQTYRWWSVAEQQSVLPKLNSKLEQNLRKAFWPSYFYVFPAGRMQMNFMLPDAYKTENLRAEDLQFLGDFIGAQVLLTGEVKIEKSSETSESYKLFIRLQGLQTSNGRSIAEVARQFDTESGAFDSVVEKKFSEVILSVSQDLSAQILEAWQKGTFGASLVKVTIRGNIPISKQPQLKQELQNRLREIKMAKERVITSDQIVYEVDSSINASEMANKLKGTEFLGKKIHIETAFGSELVLSLK